MVAELPGHVGKGRNLVTAWEGGQITLDRMGRGSQIEA